MSINKDIPIHDFARDNKDSIPFKHISLGALTNYDFSLPHRHNYYEIFFFTKGGGEHLIDFKSYTIKDHSIHFISPGQVHLIRRAPDSNGCILLFSRDFFYLGTDDKYTLFNFPFLNNSRYPTLSTSKVEYLEFDSILGQIKKEYEKQDDIFTQIIRSYLNIILLKCLHLFNEKHPQQVLPHSSVFNSFREMVEKEYRAQRQPAHYATQLNITEKKLNGICKDNSGENAGNYIKNRVLLEAKRLLNNTNHNIKEIAYFLGFEDPSYFNRFFRAKTGLTAGDFRKKAISTIN